MIKKLMLAAAIMTPSASNAECTMGACRDVKINFVYVDGSSDSWISTTGNEMLLNECVPSGGTLLKIDPANPRADWLYSTALSAYLNKIPVTVRLSTAIPATCTIAYITLGALN